MDLYDISLEELDRRIQDNRDEAAKYVSLHGRGACDCKLLVKRNNEAFVVLKQVQAERTGIDPAPYRMGR